MTTLLHATPTVTSSRTDRFVGALTPTIYVVARGNQYVLRHLNTDLVVFDDVPCPSPCDPDVVRRLDENADVTQDDIDALSAMPHWRHLADRAMAPLRERNLSLSHVWSLVDHIRRHTTYVDESDAPLEHWLYDHIARLIRDA